jgi:hypothetical protein
MGAEWWISEIGEDVNDVYRIHGFEILALITEGAKLMTDEPLIDVMKERILMLEQKVEHLENKEIRVVLEQTEQQYREHHRRCAFYDSDCKRDPCPDCDLAVTRGNQQG